MIVASKTWTSTAPWRLALIVALCASAAARAQEESGSPPAPKPPSTTGEAHKRRLYSDEDYVPPPPDEFRKSSERRGSSTSDRAYKEPQYILAIGVGVSKSLPPIPGASRDPELIAGVWPGVKRTILRDREATASRIADALSEIKDRVKPGGYTVIFVSSHGGRFGGQWTMCPYDFDAEKPSATGIDGRKLGLAILPLLKRGVRVLLVVHTCHAGGLRAQIENLLNESYVTHEGYRPFHAPDVVPGELILLASSTPGQSSFLNDENSYFSRSLAAALRGEADKNRDGLVTLKEVRRFLSHDLPDIVRKVVAPGLNAAEQDCLLDWTLSTSEDTPLSRKPEDDPEQERERRRLDEEANRRALQTMQRFGRMSKEEIEAATRLTDEQIERFFNGVVLDGVTGLPSDVPYSSLAGEWQYVRRISSDTGTITGLIRLTLRENGSYSINYLATVTRRGADERKAAKRLLEKNGSGRFGIRVSQALGPNSQTGELLFETENNRQAFKIESRDHDTMTIRVGVGDGLAPLWAGEWTLRRRQAK